MNTRRAMFLFSVFCACGASAAFAQQAPASPSARQPQHNAKNVCIDTHLTLTFNAPPALGKSGFIHIYDAADDKLIDTLDVSIPAVQQDYIIGGSTLHAYPVIIDANSAVIYPHNNQLAYNKTYYVQIDPSVLAVSDAPFAGITGKDGWVFSTKAAPPAPGTDRVTVSADGSADFATVQGAIDFVPKDNAKRLTLFLRKGVYTEIVSFMGKNNVTFLGEDRDKTIVQYANHNNLQPAAGLQFTGSSYRRGVFMGLNSSGVVLANFTVHNLTPGTPQAEGVLFKEVRNQAGSNQTQVILTYMSLYSHIDTLQITGQAYITDTYIEGDGDYMWGDGPAFFIDSSFRNLKNGSSFTQPRNPATHHGFVFVDSKFDGADGVTRAYLGNGGANSETVLINCRLGTMAAPNGWNSRGANNAEFNLTNLSDGKPYDISQWPAFIKHLDKEKDAEAIAHFRDPAWFLGGWTPALAPLILTQPAAANADAGKPVKLSVIAAGIPAATYQWQHNGTPVKDGNGVSGSSSDTLTFASAAAADAGNYTVTVTNSNGTATSAAAALTVH